MNNEILTFAHIGDLHLTKNKEQNYIDLLSIVSQIEINCADKLDFVFLPGDNADNGLPQQYMLLNTALKMLSKPVHIITGDHDMEPKSLNNFKNLSFARELPMQVSIKGYSCLFLDVCGPGSGGPDFRLGDHQLKWLQEKCEAAKTGKEQIVIFMHTFPDDLKDYHEKQTVNQLIAEHDVVLVDMGHTHYNELANDGYTVFSATRSTGQIEEGPVGYSLITIDNGKVSWRFKPLADPFPFVMITSPADYRLARTNKQDSNESTVRAVAFGEQPITDVQYRAGDGKWVKMQREQKDDIWYANVAEPLDSEQMISVQATDDTGRPGIHQIMIKHDYKLPDGLKPGSDEWAVGPWPENGVFGTQLGPNRNGKPSK